MTTGSAGNSPDLLTGVGVHELQSILLSLYTLVLPFPVIAIFELLVALRPPPMTAEQLFKFAVFVPLILKVDSVTRQSGDVLMPATALTCTVQFFANPISGAKKSGTLWAI